MQQGVNAARNEGNKPYGKDNGPAFRTGAGVKRQWEDVRGVDCQRETRGRPGFVVAYTYCPASETHERVPLSSRPTLSGQRREPLVGKVNARKQRCRCKIQKCQS